MVQVNLCAYQLHAPPLEQRWRVGGRFDGKYWPEGWGICYMCNTGYINELRKVKYQGHNGANPYWQEWIDKFMCPHTCVGLLYPGV